MKITPTETPVTELEADAVVVGMYSNRQHTQASEQLNRATEGLLDRMVDEGEFQGKANELLSLVEPRGLKARRAVVVGLGSSQPLDWGALSRAMGTAARHLSARPRTRVGWYFDPQWPAAAAEHGLVGALVACHGQDLYRAEKTRLPFAEVVCHGTSATVLETARHVAEAVNLTRRLVNEPPQYLYPETFADAAQEVAQRTGTTIDVWDVARLEKERCGALLAVARGSSRPARLVQLKYMGADPSRPPLALIGKGVTFDSGGLSLKPSESMQTMKMDMAGAATVLGAFQAIVQLQLPINLVALAGLVENMPGSAAFKLGDVLVARNGTTIEVLNTDAEGRLVLADVLSVALDHQPAAMIDLATLTGACVVALGNDVAGAMTNNQAWCDQILRAASACGEPLWQLPMFPEYAEQIKSEVADIKNIGQGRWGGAITAAKFLEVFVGSCPWTHLDIAGPAFQEKPKPWLDAGATGLYVRTLLEVARHF